MTVFYDLEEKRDSILVPGALWFNGFHKNDDRPDKGKAIFRRCPVFETSPTRQAYIDNPERKRGHPDWWFDEVDFEEIRKTKRLVDIVEEPRTEEH